MHLKAEDRLLLIWLLGTRVAFYQEVLLHMAWFSRFVSVWNFVCTRSLVICATKQGKVVVANLYLSEGRQPWS